MAYVLALDQGTTSSRAIVFNGAAEVVATAQGEFEQLYPQAGWVEHDPQAIWQTQRDVACEAVSKAQLTARDIAAIGITNQRETTLLWDRNTGEPLGNAIVWQDRRTARYCDELKAGGEADRVQRVTGLVVDAYFSASKLRWMLDNLPGARQRADRGELAFGTVDTWLLWNLTKGQVHATDVTNASRTMLMNLRACEWDEGMLALFDIPRAVLPEIRPSSGDFGVTDLLGAPAAITGVAGDQQAALFGQACFDPGLAKNTYGTGCFMLLNVGANPATSEHKLLSTLACSPPPRRAYALEGSVFIGGAVVQWLRDGLGVIQNAAEVESLAQQANDNGGVYLVPAFAGLGAPHWDPYARGAIVGLTRGSSAAHLARAALEAIAFQVADVLDVMAADRGGAIDELRVDGGATGNDLLMQFQADVLGIPVVRLRVTETTALGAAFLAGLACGVWANTEELAACWQVERRFEPRMRRDEVAALRNQWSRALCARGQWEQDDAAPVADAPPLDSGLTCPWCRYNLTTLDSDRCPECGKRFVTAKPGAAVIDRAKRGCSMVCPDCGFGNLTFMPSRCANCDRKFTLLERVFGINGRFW